MENKGGDPHAQERSDFGRKGAALCGIGHHPFDYRRHSFEVVHTCSDNIKWRRDKQENGGTNMKNLKKASVILLSLCLILGIVACSSEPSAEESIAGRYTAGTHWNQMSYEFD